tara:strand:+ start:714 stop:1136 length:423 start_codon:yes stop_codon:yes gene_type:complete
MNKTKTVWNTSDASPTIAHESPLEPGVYHIPAGAVEVEPPLFDPVKQVCTWIGEEWVVEDIPILKKEPNPNPIPAIEQLRFRRNGLLLETDWWMYADTPDPSQAQLDYRKALRDLPATVTPGLDEEGNLTGVTWPEKPKV